MNKVIRKWFWAWQFGEEEKWLNEMASKGWALKTIGFCKYTFEPCNPGEYNIRLEMLSEIPTSEKSTDYIEFIEDTGAEYVGSLMRWVYFRKKTDDGEFKLFSDNSSRISYLNRILTLLATLSVTEIVIGIANLGIGIGTDTHFFINKFAAVLCMAVGLLILYGTWTVYRQKKKIIQENTILQ